MPIACQTAARCRADGLCSHSGPSVSVHDDHTAASASAERRAAVFSSVIGGFHIAIVRLAAGEPSRSTTVTSSWPVRRSASSPGLATVAEARRMRGAVP